VLDADGFAAFTEVGNAFDPELSARLKAIYSAGDTRDPMELYCAFRRREPRIAALLQQRGLAAAQSG
jgi:peptidyl-dipeptidase Dcp